MDDRDMKSVSTKQLSIANTAKKYRHEPITVLHPNLDLHWCGHTVLFRFAR